MAKIALLPGDGIGVEITKQAALVLETVSAKYGLDLELNEGLLEALHMIRPEQRSHLRQSSSFKRATLYLGQ